MHVHSPASSDYCGDKKISAYDFVSAFVARGFDLIAITDHNTGLYIDEAIRERDQIESVEGKNITILPGVELTVDPGVHLLAILPEGGSKAISDLLSRLGLPVEKHGDSAELITESIDVIADVVYKHKGLLIGAHCNSDHGIVKELKGQSRLNWLRTVDALEFNSESEDGKVLKDMNYVNRELHHSTPFTFGSDSHDCASQSTGMWVKMAEPSLMSLRQLTFEPELRVSRTEPNAPSHGRIVGFTTTHGIYGKERFQFSPHLNVIIGGRGAGKSAAIDLLRFAFEADPSSDDENSLNFTDRIVGFLQSIGEVIVVIVGTDSKTYVVIRSGAYEKLSPRRAPTFTKQARVYQVVDDDLIQLDIRPLDVLGIEFYGQGEAARLANRVSEQLRLIDENIDHSNAAARIADAEQQLKLDEVQLIENERRLEELRVQAAARPLLEKQRNSLAKFLADPIFDERANGDYEKDWIQRRQDWVESLLEILPEELPASTHQDIDIEKSQVRVILEGVQKTSKRILRQAQGDLNRFHETLREVQLELQAYRSKWNCAFKDADDKYRARLAELEAASLEDVATQHRCVEQELTHIKNSVEPEIQQLESDRAVLERKRTHLLEKLRDARQMIASSRANFVQELNSRLGGSVVVEFSGKDTGQLFDILDSSLQGTRIQRREEQLSLVCNSFTVNQIAEIVRDKSVDKLISIGVTENTATRMFTALIDEVLYELERVDMPLLPVIRIRREGEDDYTELSSLSVGEKCSAILSIALLSKVRPLIIDQPEDDLDHAFIVNSIVRGIRSAKEGRQILAATHNPNVPVLGDAEMVFRVTRKTGKDICRIQNSGGLELPQVTEEVQSLEGGAEAFERRRQRYSGVS